ncbi:MAG: glycosyl hydrolase [bacterium]|nr:glycosyl hydrolase [bacterium]
MMKALHRYRFLWIVYLFSCGVLVLPGWGGETETRLQKQFVNPPESSRPWVYWFIMDGNFSKEGITADLEAMHQAGIGGVMLLEVNVGIPRGPVDFMSAEWRVLFKHAVEEAERLGLEITLNAGPGWTGSGGPWVKAEQSMQHLVASETAVTGPLSFSAVLPKPAARKPYFGEGGLPQTLLDAREAFYEDVAVLAVPRNTKDYRIPLIDQKALYIRDPYTSVPGVKPFLPAPAVFDAIPAEQTIPHDAIIDLTERLQADGTLQWDVPEGEWTILRFGRRNTGANTRPAPEPGLGFECDKFDRAALEAHYHDFVGTLLNTIGPRPMDRTSGWTMLHIDSWEMGAQNWTAAFRDEFQRRRGYDPLPYLPVMTGRVVESLELSERFLWDIRLTAQELVIENHAQYLLELGARDGFGLSIEPYDMNPTADLVLGAVADVPMCEFWSVGYGFDSNFSCFEATSIAHTHGRPIVAAEAFTADSGEAWKQYPASMKDQGDWALATGINRFVFHRYAHQPWLDRKPGMTMGPYGVHWERTQTWWPLVSSYHQYLARCQTLLREGATVADLCYLIPEGAPHVFRPPSSALEGILPDRKGYNFDGCDPDTLIQRASVEHGCVVFPGGASYSLLVLPNFETMTPALLKKIQSLLQAGATVVGNPPQKSPSLVNYPACDAEVQTLAAAIWGEKPTKPVEIRSVGKGTLVTGDGLYEPSAVANLPSAIEQAQWIWYPEGEPQQAAPMESRFFQRMVTLPSRKPIEAARLEITADNGFAVWINGQKVGEANNFHTVFSYDVKDLLLYGDNLIAIEGRNDGASPNPAGLIAALQVLHPEGETTLVGTDGEWSAAQDAGGDWRMFPKSGGAWTGAKVLGPAGMGPWQLRTDIQPLPELYPPYELTAAVLADRGVLPDFASEGPVRYTHRRVEGTDLYFVANRTGEPIYSICRFRVEGKKPQLWDPIDGTVRALPEYEAEAGQTAIRLAFAPSQSYFVVFAEPNIEGKPDSETYTNFPAVQAVAPLHGPWEVTFDPALGGPGRVPFLRLQDWTEWDEPGIRFYSGPAVYQTTFDLPPVPRREGDRLVLELGEVRHLAQVRLNGVDLGVVWCAPWCADLTEAVKEKGNVLEITVANLWPNRLIGDLVLPEDQRIAWTTWSHYKADDPLLPSGLLGPVRLALLKW